MKLGKRDYIPDARTAKLANFLLDIPVPEKFDFDKKRAKFPIQMWGNDRYGDCVKAGQANHLLRLERIETRRTLHFSDEDVIAEYVRETIREFGEPFEDGGLYVKQSIGNWRNVGWPLTDKRTYKISAYGELNPLSRHQIRQGIYLLHGVHFGFLLPVAAQSMTDSGYWDYNGETGAAWQPGSWGGHLVYGKRYDDGNVYVLTWGREIRVNNAFVERYCDEAWAVVDDFNSWRTKQTVDIAKLREYLSDIGATSIDS